ncbi:MAG: septum formation inhibitor Maf [Bacteroidetes bacterium]|nr:septum formation inhibitor Maf [Bacteroidota bacterium]
MNRLILLFLPPFLSLTLIGCGVDEAAQNHSSFAKMQVPDEFAEYWFAGEAELNSYKLDIMRYGEKRTGHAVNVFVTEDLSHEKQVKLDNPSESPNDRVPVLKLNQLYKFETGIYDYSMMSSVFTPINFRQDPHSLKTTCSVQDWCGQTFTQLNREKKNYRFRQYSYFESEGDVDKSIRPEMLEDEIWNRLRIDPNSIPEGEVLLFPGNFFLRLSHEDTKPRAARIQFEASEATGECIIEYLHLDRTLRIHFQSSFPHRILSWTVVQGKQQMVNATLLESLKSPYWNKHDNKHAFLRDSLKLN